MNYVLALDQGTTSSRALLIDANGAVKGLAQRPLTPLYPQPGWVEQDPLEIISTQLDVAAEVLRQQSVGANDVVAIGITNQRETTILWDRATGKPLSNAIVWQDRRTASRCEELRASGVEEMIRRRTGLLLDPYFSATKLEWLLNNISGARARAERGELAFGTVDCWLLWHLTGGRVHATDVSNASRTLLWDMHRREWDGEILQMLGISPSLLPSVRSSAAPFGETSSAELPKGIPITALIGDQQSALFGQRCIHSGMAKTTYGTGSFIVAHTGTESIESKHRLLSTVAWERNGQREYALEGSVFTAGAVVQWLRDELGIIRTAAEVEELAGSVDDAHGVYLVPAFAGLGAPHWDASARGAILGLTRGANRAHIARAALEAIAFQVVEVAAAMEGDSGVQLTEMRVDGGATVNNLLMQMQADLLGVPVTRSKNAEATALGAAYLAGLHSGFWSSDSQVDALWARELTFEPRMSKSERETRLEGWLRAVERSMRWT